MKKFLAAILLSFATLCTQVQAQSSTNINPINVARAFALKTPVSFHCILNGNALISNAWVHITYRFTMQASDFAITSLTVNDTNIIDLPNPIYSLPIGDGGMMTDVGFNADSWTSAGEWAGSGFSQVPVVSKGDLLTLVIDPAGLKIQIPLSPNIDTTGLSLQIKNFTGTGYGYGADPDGKFFVYIDPTQNQYDYVVRSSDGAVVSEGTIEPFKAVATAKDTYFNITYAGNVLNAVFMSPNQVDDYIQQYMKFDCLIPTAAGEQYGKVLFTDAGSGGLEVIIDGAYDVTIQSVTESGDMPYLALNDRSSGGQTQVNTVSQGIGKVVVSIIPKKNGIYNTYVNLHLFHGPLGATVIGEKG